MSASRRLVCCLVVLGGFLLAGCAEGRLEAPTEVTATSSDGVVAVRWKPPKKTGGFLKKSHPVRGYLVRAHPGAVKVSTEGGVTTASFSGLNPRTAYTFTVQSLDDKAEGPVSSPSAPVTPRPEAEVLQVSLPPDGGCTPLEYRVRRLSGAPVDIRVEYDASGTGTFRHATPAASPTREGLHGVTTTPDVAGQAHSFLWDTSRDLPPRRLTGMTVRVSALVDGLLVGRQVLEDVELDNTPRFSRSRLRPVGTRPTAVTTGDFNHDGRPDFAIADENDNAVGLRLGQGDGTFQQGALARVGARPVALVAEDFDRDGRLDLAVANQGDASVSLLRGMGNGSFREAVRLAVADQPVALVAGDFNRDGWLDLAVANRGDASVSLLRGSGGGSFQEAVRLQAGASPASVTAGDFDRDGRLDLAVSNPDDDSVSVLRGNGDGSFRAATHLTGMVRPTSLEHGDFDRDGRLDLAVGHGANVSLLFGIGDGSFRSAVRIGDSAISSIQDLESEDLNGDGLLDLVAARADSLTLLFSKGDGSFQVQRLESDSIGGRSLSLVDFNGDGKRELVLVNPSDASAHLLLNPRQACSGFDLKAPVVSQGLAPHVHQVVDLNLDGKLDLVMLDGMSTTSHGDLFSLAVGLGEGQGSFRPTVQGRDVSLGRSFAVAVGDFTGDGLPDIGISSEWQEDPIEVLPGDGLGGFTRTASSQGGTHPYRALLPGDFNRDGKADLVGLKAPVNGNEVHLLLGGGDGTFQRTLLEVPQAQQVLVADFDGDGVDDLVTRSQQGDSVSVLLSGANGSFQAASSTPLATAAPLVTADLNGDGRADLLSTDAAGQVVVLLGKGDGAFLPAAAFAAASASSQLHIADFNEDGWPDVLAESSSQPASVLLGKGDGTLQAPRTLRRWSGRIQAVGDFDGDGVPDLFLAPPGERSLLLLHGNGDGSFWEEGAAGTGAPSGALASADLNGDGRQELVTANTGSGTVSVLRGNGDATFQPALGYAVGAEPRALALGDLDRDGRWDIVTANTGSGTVSVLRGNGDGTFQPATGYAVGAEPHALAIGDFNRDGWWDVVTANTGSGTVSVLRGNGDGTLQTAVQLSADTRPTALVAGDFNADGWLDLALAGDDYTRGSVVLLGKGGGEFESPRVEAAWGGSASLVAGDFNVDGRLDLVSIHASGTVLVRFGGGDGSFSLKEGAFYRVRGAALAVAADDFNRDGRLDFAVSGEDVRVLLQP